MTIPPGKPRHRWTPAEDAIVRRDYPHKLTHPIAAALGLTDKQVYRRAMQLGLRKTPEYLASPEACRLRRGGEQGIPSRFKPGNVPWNAGTKGQGLSGMHPNTVANHFGPGHRPHGWKPVGATRISHDGYLQRKMTDTGYPPRDWVPVHRMVWEAAHGPIPPGHRIVFRSGKPITDEAAITADALECVTPAEVMRRNSYHNHLPPELARVVQLRGQLVRAINKKRAERQQPHGAGQADATGTNTTATP